MRAMSSLVHHLCHYHIIKNYFVYTILCYLYVVVRPGPTDTVQS